MAIAAKAGDTTMVVAADWGSITSVVPPTQLDPFAGLSKPSVLPVRCYVCSVCGYVEMYAGTITDPDTWGHRVR